MILAEYNVDYMEGGKCVSSTYRLIDTLQSNLAYFDFRF